jgi:hypothetical protein
MSRVRIPASAQNQPRLTLIEFLLGQPLVETIAATFMGLTSELKDQRSELLNCLVNQTVITPEKIVRREDVRDEVPCGVVEHQTTDHALLGLNRMRWG